MSNGFCLLQRSKKLCSVLGLAFSFFRHCLVLGFSALVALRTLVSSGWCLTSSPSSVTFRALPTPCSAAPPSRRTKAKEAVGGSFVLSSHKSIAFLLFSLVGVKGSLSLLDIFLFPGGLGRWKYVDTRTTAHILP